MATPTLGETAQRLGRPDTPTPRDLVLDGLLSLEKGASDALARLKNRADESVLVDCAGAGFVRVEVAALVRARWEHERGALIARAERAERDARQRAEFIASISHEIRTPMTALLGYAELLGDDELSDADRARMISSVRRSGEHLMGIVNDVLDFSKLDAGKMSVTIAEASPARIVEDVVSLLRDRAERKGLVLVGSCGPLPERVQTDALRLRQILINLVGNAIKFTQSGRIDVEAIALGGRLCFAVRDTGPGIPPDRLSDLFEPFAQLQGGMETAHGGSHGTGLGLSISRRLARLLGGDIEVQSAPGAGSTFTLRVAMAPALPALPPAPGRLAGARLLLVEDGPDNSALFATLLRRAGASVTLAMDGREGVDQALRARAEPERLDLILMDVDMPGIDGIMAAKEIRSRGCTTPILAISAHVDPGLREACIGSGCDDLLRKPITREELIGACVRAIALRSHRAAG